MAAGIPALFYLVFSFMIPESPRWLITAGRKDDARTAYTNALTNLDAAAPNHAFLEMKLSDLGTEKTGS